MRTPAPKQKVKEGKQVDMKNTVSRTMAGTACLTIRVFINKRTRTQGKHVSLTTAGTACFQNQKKRQGLCAPRSAPAQLRRHVRSLEWQCLPETRTRTHTKKTKIPAGYFILGLTAVHPRSHCQCCCCWPCASSVTQCARRLQTSQMPLLRHEKEKHQKFVSQTGSWTRSRKLTDHLKPTTVGLLIHMQGKHLEFKMVHTGFGPTHNPFRI